MRHEYGISICKYAKKKPFIEKDLSVFMVVSFFVYIYYLFKLSYIQQTGVFSFFVAWYLTSIIHVKHEKKNFQKHNNPKK
jgi:hypothetical protein